MTLLVHPGRQLRICEMESHSQKDLQVYQKEMYGFSFIKTQNKRSF